jgi:hypothetical protein
MPTVSPTNIKARKHFPFKAVVIVIAPGQGTAASGFIPSIEANMKGFFEADNVPAFAFLPTRGNLPFLFLWTRNSALRFSARVLEFNDAEYHHSDG